ncbi:MAG: glycoside hydrolase family 3 C-terminal domain-containing protein [Saccharospirillaceae bacterium]|nr:glycoside hydrolase family 3 C-terminal domain-containing protein [Saccharospirillaceae bacterium]
MFKKIDLKGLKFKQVMLALSVSCLIITMTLYNYHVTSIVWDEPNEEKIKSLLAQDYLKDWPKLKPIINLTAQQKNQINEIMQAMSLEQKVAQMLMVPIDYDSGVKLMQFNLANVFIQDFEFGESGIKNSRLLDKTDQFWLDLKQDIQSKGLPFIPPFICLDSINGNHVDSNAVMFPSTQAIGAAHDFELTHKIGEASAQQFSAVGINCRSQSLETTISAHPKHQVEHFKAFYKGSQKTKKVFDVVGSFALNMSEFEEDTNYYSAPIFAALNEGALAVNIVFNEFDDNNFIDILRNKMQFQGLVTTSINSFEQINGCWLGQCDQVFNSGVDLIPITPKRDHDKIKVLIDNVIKSIQSGKIQQSKIEEAVKRILTVKMHMGMFNGLSPFTYSEKNIDYKKMQNEHQQLARNVIQKSAVLIKNSNNILPMSRDGKYLIVGNAIDDTRYQLNYKNNRNATKFGSAFKKYATNATYIKPMFLNEYEVVASLMKQHNYSTMKVNRELRLSPIKMQLKVPKGGQLKIDALNQEDDSDRRYQFTGKEYDIYLERYRDKIREYVAGFERLIFVMNEPDYSAMQSSFLFTPESQTNFIDVIKDVDIEVVIIFLTNEPSYVPSAMNKSSAFVVVWKPGGEIESLMPLLFKDENNRLDKEFTGTLSKSWPKHGCDFTHYLLSDEKKPRFPFGYGLSNKDRVDVWEDLYDVQNFCQFVR